MCILRVRKKSSFGIKCSKKLRPFSHKYRIQIGGVRVKLSKQKFFNRLNKGCFVLYRKNKSYNLFVRNFAHKIYESNSLGRKKWFLKKITKRQSVRLKYMSLYSKFFSLELNLDVFFFHRNYFLNFRVVRNVQLKSKYKLSKLINKYFYLKFRYKIFTSSYFGNKKRHTTLKSRKTKRREKFHFKLLPKFMEVEKNVFNILYNKDYKLLVNSQLSMNLEILRKKRQKCLIRNFWILNYDAFFRRKLNKLRLYGNKKKKLVKSVSKLISIYELYQFYIFKLFFMKPRLVTNSQFVYSKNYYVICLLRSELNLISYIVKKFLIYSNVMTICSLERKTISICPKEFYKKKNKIWKLKKKKRRLLGRCRRDFKKYRIIKKRYKSKKRKKNKIFKFKVKANKKYKYLKRLNKILKKIKLKKRSGVKFGGRWIDNLIKVYLKKVLPLNRPLNLDIEENSLFKFLSLRIRKGYFVFFKKNFVSFDICLYYFLKVFIRNLLMDILKLSNYMREGFSYFNSRNLLQNFIVEKLLREPKKLNLYRSRVFLVNNKSLILNKFFGKKINNLGIKEFKIETKLLLLINNKSLGLGFFKRKINEISFNYFFKQKNLNNSKAYLLELIRSYKVWLFFINYSLNYYIFFKLHYLFINHFFKMIYHKFIKLIKILKLNGFEFCYELIKKNDNTRYELAINPRIFVKTFNKRLKKGFSVPSILRDIKALLNIYYKNKNLKGYYIRVKGRFQRGRRKRTIRVRKGDIAFNSVHLEIDSCYGILYSRFGVAGLKIIFAY